ncbi:MarR family winged helix-turn-helix transcriptional regulator [Solirhodobacter olei]|uniref:MarR family winged helix-turn-helix transcriptional regulator n=1 Tax=Solirhodobacter olei TaxID=2493082 RepID=UPI0019D44BFC|nr:MarR family transcriptional regulator [Solirhodobacter olei]
MTDTHSENHARREDQEIDLGPLADYIGFALRNAQEAAFRAFARRVETVGLKPGRFAALMVIHHNPGLTQMELGRAIARDKSSVTPLIQELQRHGLVARKASEEDRRRNALRLTTAGEDALAGLLVHAAEHDRKLDAIVGEHKDLFLDLLRRVTREIQDLQ